MAEPKAGKFRYRLDTVLKVRDIKERQEQEEFAKKKRDYLTEKQEEEKISAHQKKRAGELRNMLKRGPITDFERVLRRRAHLGVVKKDLDQQVEKVVQASQKLEEQRMKLIDAMKDKKIIDRHKEKQLDAWRKVMQDLETKFLDEIGTIRYIRDKKQEG